MILDGKCPTGPIETSWDRHRFESKLVNPANKRKYKVLCVGTGLAGGAAAASLGEAPDIDFTGAEVAALDGVVEQAVDRVTVVRIVLGGVDAALGCDRVGAAGAVLVTEGLDLVTEFTEGRRGSATGETGADAENFVFTFVGRIDQLRLEAMTIPGSFNWSGRTLAVEYH